MQFRQIEWFIQVNPLSANLTKWSNTLKQFVGNLPTNCLSVFEHFVILALKGLIQRDVELLFTFFCVNLCIFSMNYIYISWRRRKRNKTEKDENNLIWKIFSLMENNYFKISKFGSLFSSLSPCRVVIRT